MELRFYGSPPISCKDSPSGHEPSEALREYMAEEDAQSAQLGKLLDLLNHAVDIGTPVALELTAEEVKLLLAALETLQDR